MKAYPVFLLTLAVVWCGSACLTEAVTIPGAPVGADPFIFNFDEFGNGSFQVFVPEIGGYGPLTPSLGQIDGNGFLAYQLPEFVVPGDLAIFEPTGEFVLSDGLRFLDGPNTSFMEYFSDPGDDAPADTGFPSDFDVSNFIFETGPEGDNGFTYVAGSGDPATTNFYIGASDSPIPEPASLVLWALLAAIGLTAAWWRCKRA